MLVFVRKQRYEIFWTVFELVLTICIKATDRSPNDYYISSLLNKRQILLLSTIYQEFYFWEFYIVNSKVRNVFFIEGANQMPLKVS